MNKLYVLAALLIMNTAQAKEPVCSESAGQEEVKEALEIKTDTPAHLKGAVIVIRQADGSESQVSAEKFKVVPRKQQFIVTKTEKRVNKTCTSEPNKNRVSILGGYGAKPGLTKESSPGKVDVKSKVGVNAGAQYQRMLNDKWSLGVQGQTNKTTSVLFGLDF